MRAAFSASTADLLVHQQQRSCSRRISSRKRGGRSRPSPVAHLIEVRQEARLQRHRVADALTMQQPLDPVVCAVAPQQPLALARAALSDLVLSVGTRPCWQTPGSPRSKPGTPASAAQIDPSVLARRAVGSPRCSRHRSRNLTIPLLLSHDAANDRRGLPLAGQNPNRLPSCSAFARTFASTLDNAVKCAVDLVSAHFLCAGHHHASCHFDLLSSMQCNCVVSHPAGASV